VIFIVRKMIIGNRKKRIKIKKLIKIIIRKCFNKTCYIIKKKRLFKKKNLNHNNNKCLLIGMISKIYYLRNLILSKF
jgi:hypothetical protein